MEARFCHNCGAKLKENMKFCGTCGTPVLQFPEPEQEAAAPVFQPEPAAPETVMPEPAPAMPESRPVVPEPEPAAAAAEPELPVAVVEPEPAPVMPEPAPVMPEPVPIVPDPEPAFVPPAVTYTPPEPQYQPPVQPQPEQPEVPVKKIKNRYPARGVGRTILAVLLCILIFIWSFAALTVFYLRQTASGDALKDSVEDVFKNLELSEIPASSVIADVQDPSQSLTAWVIEQIQAEYSGEIELTEDSLNEFLEESAIVPFLSERMAAFVNDVYRGTESSRVTREEIEYLLRADAALIEKATGKSLTDSDVRQIADQLEASGITEILNVNAGSLKKEAAPVYYGMRFILSYWIIGFFGVLALVFILLLAKTNRWNMLRTCGDLGTTWAVLSGVMILAALFAKLLPKVWNGIFGISAIGSFVGSVLFSGLLTAMILLGVSVLLILIKTIGKRIVTKSAKAQV